MRKPLKLAALKLDKLCRLYKVVLSSCEFMSWA